MQIATHRRWRASGYDDDQREVSNMGGVYSSLYREVARDLSSQYTSHTPSTYRCFWVDCVYIPRSRWVWPLPRRRPKAVGSRAHWVTFIHSMITSTSNEQKAATAQRTANCNINAIFLRIFCENAETMENLP